jgi:hypothetical protein
MNPLARLVFAAFLVTSFARANTEIRLASNTVLNGWMRDSGATPVEQAVVDRKTRALDYYHALGFTHLLYCLERPYLPVFQKTAGGWIYNGGNYAAGDHALSLAAMKKAAERRGMTLVPFIPSLSHVEDLIALDSSMSEFDAADPKPPPPWTWSAASKDSYRKYDGMAAPGPLGYNPAADQFFRERLRIIKAVWEAQGGAGAHPPFVHIGHDELGWNQLCSVKAGRSRWRKESAAELVALEIAARARQVDSIIDSSTGLLLYADSFVPGDYGQTYGLAGDAATGEGGTLRLLQAMPGIGGRIILMPWIYSALESDGPDPYRKLIFSKAGQLRYLDRLGVPFIVAAGEDGSDPFTPFVERTKQCLFEWVREARRRPRWSRGFAHLSFNNFDVCLPRSDGAPPVCAAYSAPLLAYLAWSGGDPASRALERAYSPSLFSSIDYVKSRWDRAWEAGVHYPAPPSVTGKLP